MSRPTMLRLFPSTLLCLLAVLFLTSATFKPISAEGPADRGGRRLNGNCDTLFPTGAVRNLCHAYCDAMGCGSAEPSAPPQACTAVRQRIIALSKGIAPPCPDTDSDLVGDSADNCPNFYNPDQNNADGDVVGDACDNCVQVANADQANRDQDPLGDACDYVDNPIVTEAQVEQGGINLACEVFTDLCCVDPPLCSCCCLWLQVESLSGNARVLGAIARVSTVPGAAPIQSVVLKFADPPLSLLPPGNQVHEVEFEMFDAGSAPLGYVQVDQTTLPIVSSDIAAGDGQFRRLFFMFDSSTANVDMQACTNKTILNNFQEIFSAYFSPVSLGASQFVEYRMRVEARDTAGNAGTSPEMIFYIIGEVVQPTVEHLSCGAPTGYGGCTYP